MTVPAQKNRLYHFLEISADKAIQRGERDQAKKALHEGVQATYTHAPADYHHFAIKAVALPFYDLIYKGASDERLDEAYSVYGWIGNLIDSELENRRHYGNLHGTAYGQSLGRISELVVFGLLARDFTDAASLVPLPASRADDIDKQGGTDFYIAAVGRPETVVHVQVKNNIKASDYDRYASRGIRLIGLSAIDPLFNRPSRPNSLASRITRELAGQGSANDSEQLDAATDKMYQILSSQASATLVG